MLPRKATNFLTSLSPWERLVFTLWVIALFAVCLRSALTPQRQNVFPIFSLAGQNWLEGKPVYGAVATDRDVFRYSPVTAGFFSVWSLVPERLANVLWRLFNAGVLLLGMGWWLRELLPEIWTGAQRTTIFLLILPLTLPSLNNGQANPLLTGLLMLAVVAAANQRFTLASFCAAAAFWLKLYPVALTLLLVVIARRHFAVRFAGMLALGFVVPFLLQSPDYVTSQYADWTSYLQGDDREQLPVTLWLKDIRLLFKVWLVPISARGFLLLQLGTGLGLAGLCWLMQQRRLPQKQIFFLVTTLGFCWMTLFGPSTESTTWNLLAPSLCAFLVLGLHQSGSSSQNILLLACYALHLLSHVAHWFPWGGRLGALGIQPFAGLLFFLTVIATTVSLLRNQPGIEARLDEKPNALAA